MKRSILLILVFGAVCSNACAPAGVQPTQQSGIVGKWRSADGSYNVEFLSNGNCTARMRLRGRDLGGPCTYTVDRDTITLHYSGIEGADAAATWHYSLDDNTLNVAVFGNSMVLRRVR